MCVSFIGFHLKYSPKIFMCYSNIFLPKTNKYIFLSTAFWNFRNQLVPLCQFSFSWLIDLFLYLDKKSLFVISYLFSFFPQSYHLIWKLFKHHSMPPHKWAKSFSKGSEHANYNGIGGGYDLVFFICVDNLLLLSCAQTHNSLLNDILHGLFFSFNTMNICSWTAKQSMLLSPS